VSERELIDLVFESGLSEGPNEEEYRSRLIQQINEPFWSSGLDWTAYIPSPIKSVWPIMAFGERVVAYISALDAKSAASYYTD
jgi:hypothetical protein